MQNLHGILKICFIFVVSNPQRTNFYFCSCEFGAANDIRPTLSINQRVISHVCYHGTHSCGTLYRFCLLNLSSLLPVSNRGLLWEPWTGEGGLRGKYHNYYGGGWVVRPCSGHHSCSADGDPHRAASDGTCSGTNCEGPRLNHPGTD